MASKSIQTIPIDKVRRGTDIRSQTGTDKRAELAATLRDNGQLVPVIVWPDSDGFYLLDGHCRVDALAELGCSTVEAQVLDQPPSRAEALVQALICNTQREELSSLELAQAIYELREETGWTATQSAARLGMSDTTVSRLLSLLALPEPIQEFIRSGRLAASTAAELVKVADPAKQAELAQAAVNGELSRDAASAQVKRAKRNVENGSKPRTRKQKRAVMPLGDGRSVTVSGKGLSLERLIAWLEELLAKARKARTQGWELAALAKSLRTQSKNRLAEEQHDVAV